jgi:thymidylate kinase
MSQFWTVLAGDYSGKAEVFQALRRDTGWPVISCDDPYVDGHPVVRWLRKFAFFEAYSRVGQPYSAELAFSLLTPIALYLRDEVIRAAANGPAIVDSYYYALLAKGVITGIADERTCAAWRSLLQPVPQGVVFLDVDPEVAWNRARGAVNPFEYYGAEPTWEGFAKFQQDLRSVLLDQIKGLPAVVIDANRPARRVAADVIAALREIGMPQEKISSFVA